LTAQSLARSTTSFPRKSSVGKARVTQRISNTINILEDPEPCIAERLIAHYTPAHERYNELFALPHEVDNILGDGAARLLPIVTETMREVKEKVGLR